MKNEEIHEMILDLLTATAENVSANHWINAIHENKFEDLTNKIMSIVDVAIGIQDPPQNATIDELDQKIHDIISAKKPTVKIDTK